MISHGILHILLCKTDANHNLPPTYSQIPQDRYWEWITVQISTMETYWSSSVLLELLITDAIRSDSNQMLVHYKSGSNFDICSTNLFEITIIEMDKTWSSDWTTAQEAIKIRESFPPWAVELKFFTTASSSQEQC